VTDRSCEQLRDMLVDYADGELSTQDAQAVAEHLAECRACRETVEALERSLRLAKVIWLDNLEAGKAAPIHRHVIRWWRYAAVAAAILVVAGALLLGYLHRSAEAEYALIDRRVADFATAARLLAATQILAQCEGTESIVEEQRRYILASYADTPAAATLRNDNLLRRDSQ
jgi:anti-sigma factor RsiW